MADYPDWTRLFHLVGTDITIPISIETSAVILEVNIASAVTLDVDITAQSVGTLDINLAAAAITLNVNLAAQSANISIKFADQSVAVFDAAKWFAHQATQWGVTGGGSISTGNYNTISRVVPANKVAFLCGIGVGYLVAGAAVNILVATNIAGTDVSVVGFDTGGGLIFDTPFRATAGQTIAIYVYNLSGATKVTLGSMWGYDEPS
jgi:hypothetical protein